VRFWRDFGERVISGEVWVRFGWCCGEVLVVLWWGGEGELRGVRDFFGGEMAEDEEVDDAIWEDEEGDEAGFEGGANVAAYIAAIGPDWDAIWGAEVDEIGDGFALPARAVPAEGGRDTAEGMA
jgi:hypothetical protein